MHFYQTQLAVIIVIIACPLMGYNQNNMNTGIGLGPAMTFTSITSSNFSNEIEKADIMWNFHLNFVHQFLFNDKFGLESGFTISTKYMKIKASQSGRKYRILMDSYSFPFLLIGKKPFATNPFMHLYYMAGITVERQKFIQRYNNIHKRALDNNIVQNLTLGGRISFRQGILGKMAAGLSFSYALYPSYELALRDLQSGIREIHFRSKAHLLKVDVNYFFSNKVIL